MRVLLVEDSSEIVGIFGDFGIRYNVIVDVAQSAASALAKIEDESCDFDFVVCDLKIPSADGGLDLDNSNGLRVVAQVGENFPGVPMLVLSAFGTVGELSKMLLNGRQHDIYGTGVDEPMLQYLEKIDISEAIEVLKKAQRELNAVSSIELLNGNFLSEYQRRVVKLYARRQDGRQVRYQPLSGGLSGARTGIVSVHGETGAQVGRAVGKVTTLRRAIEEENRYTSYISSRLGAGTYAGLTGRVISGCGRDAGLFYSVADRFQTDLFGLVRNKPEDAVKSVEKLESNVRTWTDGVPQSSTSWLSVRRNLIPDESFDRIRSTFDLDLIEDSRRFQAMWATQHGDLHGANVLVDEDATPVLIDFGRSGTAPSCLDPLTLELSLVFHPQSPYRAHEWPSAEQLRRWDDLDQYVAGCPYEEFVRACRGWTRDVSAGSRDIWAVISAYCLRNLQYFDVDPMRAVTLQNHSAKRLGDSY